MKDVVLRLYSRMAGVSTVLQGAGIWAVRIRCGVVVEHRISPPAGFRKPLAVFFHYERLFKEVGHIHGELSLGAFLRLPLQLHDEGTVRKSLTIAWNACFVCIDHFWVSDDHFEHFVGTSRRNERPVFVSSEVRERNSARRF